MILLIALTVLCIALIATTAYSSSLQYEINNLNSSISKSEWTQRNLEARIKSANTLSGIEAEALNMGLIYPDFDQIVYLEQSSGQEHQSLALALKLNAYE